MSCFCSIRRQRHAFKLQRPAILALIVATTVGLALLLSETRVEAAQDAGMRQFRAAVDGFFSPPRRHWRRAHKRTTVGASRTGRPAAETREPERAATEEQLARRGRSSGAKARGARASAQFVPPEAAPTPRPRPFEAPNPQRELAQTAPSIDARRAKGGQTSEQADALRGTKSGRAKRVAKTATPPAAKEAAHEPAAANDAPAKGRAADKAASAVKDSAEKTTPPQETPDAAPAGPSACQMRLGPDLASVQFLPPIHAGQCEVDDVVRLEAIVAKNGRRIALTPPATLRCPMAETVIHWVRDDVAAVASDLGAALKSLTVDTSFECRGRNRIAGAKISQHGFGNAVDLRGFTLANGHTVRLTDPAANKPARERLRQTACTRFTTVLGPGSDGYHEDHIHVDIAERRSGYRICQWDVRDPSTVVASVPLPPERPPTAPPRQASTAKK